MGGCRSLLGIDGICGMPFLLCALPLFLVHSPLYFQIVTARSSILAALVRMSIIRNYFMGHSVHVILRCTIMR